MEAVTFKKLVKGHAYSVTAVDEVRKKGLQKWLLTTYFFSNYRIVCQSIEEFLFQNQTVYAAQQHGKKK